MTHHRPFANPPELLIYAKAFLLGLAVVEVHWLGHLGGASIATEFAASLPQVRLLVVGAVAVLFITYLLARGAPRAAWLIAKSLRIDLFAVVFMGGVATVLIEPVIEPLHRAVARQNATVSLFICLVLTLIVLSVLIRALINRPRPVQHQLFFLSDDEIGAATDDALAVANHAKRFADTVLASGSSGGLVFGLDGPWGTGKTSFLNIAEEHWRASASDEVIVFRFEPLRFASDQDLA